MLNVKNFGCCHVIACYKNSLPYTGEFHGKFHEEKKTILHESMNVKLRKIVSRCSLLLLRIAYLSAMKQRPLKLLVTQDTVSASTRSMVNENILAQSLK